MKKNYNENLVAGAAIRDDKGRRISKLFESSHPNMSVGYARNLIMPSDPTEQEFNFRQSGNGVVEDGVAVIDKVKGRSVVWNQLCKAGKQSFNGIGSSYVREVFGTFPILNEHKYLLALSGDNNASTYQYIGVINPEDFSDNITFYKQGYTAIFTATKTIQQACIWDRTESNITYNIALQVHDLTQMFGAGNEPTTYEEFLQRKPQVEDEFAYDEGTIVNNKIEAVKTTGVNLIDANKFFIDNGWERIGENEYCGTADKLMNKIIYQNKEGYQGRFYLNVYGKSEINNGLVFIIRYKSGLYEFISQTTPGEYKNLSYITPENEIVDVIEGTYYSMVKSYVKELCISHYDPSINGKYFPYEEHTLDLSWIKDIKDENGVALFENGLRGAGDAFDEVKSNKATKRFAMIKMKDLNFGYVASGENTSFFWATINARKGKTTNMVSAKYANAGLTYYSNTKPDMSIQASASSGEEKKVYLIDRRFESEAALKASLTDDDYLIYELAEPIEVEFDEKNLTYPVVGVGTEKAISSEASAPMRADIGYGIDAVKTIIDLKARVRELENK